MKKLSTLSYPKVCPVKIRIRLREGAVWSESSLGPLVRRYWHYGSCTWHHLYDSFVIVVGAQKLVTTEPVHTPRVNVLIPCLYLYKHREHLLQQPSRPLRLPSRPLRLLPRPLRLPWRPLRLPPRPPRLPSRPLSRIHMFSVSPTGYSLGTTGINGARISVIMIIVQLNTVFVKGTWYTCKGDNSVKINLLSSKTGSTLQWNNLIFLLEWTLFQKRTGVQKSKHEVTNVVSFVKIVSVSFQAFLSDYFYLFEFPAKLCFLAPKSSYLNQIQVNETLSTSPFFRIYFIKLGRKANHSKVNNKCCSCNAHC